MVCQPEDGGDTVAVHGIMETRSQSPSATLHIPSAEGATKKKDGMNCIAAQLIKMVISFSRCAFGQVDQA